MLVQASQIEAYVDGLAADRHFSGSVLVSKEGGILLAKGYGKANKELNINNHAHTRHRIGSITKSFTAIAILQLVEKGLIRLEDPIGRYFPGQTGGDRITVHHLLTHTSGIPDYFNRMEEQELRAWITNPSSTAELIDRFCKLPLDFDPGELYSYSNSGYVLLGALIERMTGQDYGDYFRDNIFVPAGMTDTAIDRAETIIPDRSAGYQLNQHGQPENAPYIDMSNTHPPEPSFPPSRTCINGIRPSIRRACYPARTNRSCIRRLPTQPTMLTATAG